MATVLTATDKDFDGTLKKYPDKLVVVDFYADWCMPCKLLGPIMEKVAAAHADRVVLVKVNVDANPQKSEQYEISGIPAVKFFKNGIVVDEFVGYHDQGAIESMIEKNLK